MMLSCIKPESLSRDQLKELVFGDFPPPPPSADCILVFGGQGEERVRTAVQLYHAGVAPFILFTGGTKWGKYETPQAVTMQRAALTAGVPEDAICLACNSNNTKENVLDALLVLDRRVGLHKLHQIAVVSIPWHMRRCLLTLKTYAPGWFRYSWAPAAYSQHQRDNWWRTPDVDEYVREEARNLVAYVREGQLLDEDVTGIEWDSQQDRE